MSKNKSTKEDPLKAAISKTLQKTDKVFPKVKSNPSSTKKVGRPAATLSKEQISVMKYEPEEEILTKLSETLSEGLSFSKRQKITTSDIYRAALYIAAGNKTNLQAFKEQYWKLPK